MKKVVFVIALILTFSMTYAQRPLEEGEKQLNAGLGSSNFGMPLYFGIDYGATPDISVGGELSVRTYSEDYSGHSYNHSIIGLSGNGNYHFNRLLSLPSEWDFYAGLNLGFYIWNSPSGYEGDHSSGLGLGAQVGGRYYFNDRIGLNLEFGGGAAFGDGKIGVSWKF